MPWRSLAKWLSIPWAILTVLMLGAPHALSGGLALGLLFGLLVSSMIMIPVSAVAIGVAWIRSRKYRKSSW